MITRSYLELLLKLVTSSHIISTLSSQPFCLILFSAIFNKGLDKSTTLSATVAFGVAVGAIIAAFFIKMKDSTKILPIGIFMGFVVCSIFFVTTWETAAIILTIVGVLSGLLIVPLNALLQHRGHILVGAGHSIAVQNFSENLGILLLSGAYTFMVKGNIPINGIMFIFGFFVLLSMTIASIYYAKANN